MTNHVTVAGHGRRVSKLGFVFALGIIGYVLVVNLLYLRFLGNPKDFFTSGNLAWILVFAGFIGSCALYRLYRLSGDGANVARWLGGRLVVLEPGEENLRVYRNVATEVAIAAGIPMPRPVHRGNSGDRTSTAATTKNRVQMTTTHILRPTYCRPDPQE